MKVARNMGASENRRVTEMRAELVRRIGSHIRVDGVEATDIPGVELYRRSAPTPCMSGHYEPKLIVFVQGKKRINVGKTVYVCDRSNFLLTSINLPVVSQVIAASVKEPIMGLMPRRIQILPFSCAPKVAKEQNRHRGTCPRSSHRLRIIELC